MVISIVSAIREAAADTWCAVPHHLGFETGMLKGCLSRAAERALLKVAMAGASRVRIGGFELFHRPDLREHDEVIARVQAGIHMVAQHDVRRHRRMQRDMHNLLIVTGRGFQVFTDLRLGSLNERWIVQATPIEVALMLVEMAARARIGLVRSMDNKFRPRVWRRSTLEQLAFVSKLPDAARSSDIDLLVAHLHRKLQEYGSSAKRRRRF